MQEYERTYQVICETLVCEEGPYRTYGIMTQTGPIRDISTNRQFVEEMAGMFNRIGVEPARTWDIIEHMLP